MPMVKCWSGKRQEGGIDLTMIYAGTLLLSKEMDSFVGGSGS